MPLNIDQLNELYRDAETYHDDLFSEQRSNVQLVAGNHYSKRSHRFFDSLRERNRLTQHQRIRLTQNHIQKITKTYVNNILQHSPGVTVNPKNKEEIQDQKSAEIHRSVWEDAKYRHRFDKQTYLYAKDFVDVGEVVVKVFFDKNIGTFVGYEPETDEKGDPVLENGEPVGKPVFTGDLVYERVMGFNLLSDPDARSWETTRWNCIRKMVSIRDLRAQFKDQPDKLKFIQKSHRETYMLFDGHNGGYRNSKGLTMVREYYFRPDARYPNGYYYYTTEHGILFEGELPLGVYPILYAGFDDAATSARSFSIIKQLRGYQAEINRAASKIVEHHNTLGDDKLIVQAGSSITPGGTAHGVKAVKVSGAPPQILAGRDGSQFAGYLQTTIDQMYFVANVQDDKLEKQQANLDNYAMLFRSMKDKKRFMIYAEKFERFLKEICEATIRLAKGHYRDEMFIQTVGRKERVNIAEFRSLNDLDFEIKIQPRGEDVESMLGQQITMNHFLQFAGSQLSPRDIGLTLKNMPFVNNKEIFSDLTIDYENAQNLILALDRGEQPEPQKFDDHEYMVRRLSHRMKQPDFRFMSDDVKQLYAQYLQIYEQFLVEQQQAAAQANSGLIPSGGFLVGVDVRVPDPSVPSGSRRAKIPVEALNWLLQKLETQGTTQSQIAEQDPEVQADVGRAVTSNALTLDQQGSGNLQAV